jgi:DNA (cytosine-5)-methyltransferase 1
MHWDRPAQTLTSGFGSMGQGRYVHPRRRRLLTPHEAARLQGFPDFFDFSSVGKATALREMIANAVPPQFTAVLVQALIKAKVI